MPRKARIDIPGLLQHVIVRGIEKRKIFLDDTDRFMFVERFTALLEETKTDCFAWALIPNHFHLLLRPNRLELKHFMRRLLTGYAINFNNRHKRSGHVFRNRYKSIVCEEESYLLELIRYIHLNPLRARLVTELTSLNDYPWSGHSALMGQKVTPGQAIREVLAYFGRTAKKSRYNYYNFMLDGVDQGRRDELVGGGLHRSREGQPESDNMDLEIFDERVLGSGDFIERLRSDQMLQEKLTAGMMLPELVGRVEQHFLLSKNRITKRSKDKTVQTARDVFCYIAVRVLRYSGTDVGGILNIHRSAVSHAVRRGELVLNESNDLLNKIMKHS